MLKTKKLKPRGSGRPPKKAKTHSKRRKRAEILQRCTGCKQDDKFKDQRLVLESGWRPPKKPGPKSKTRNSKLETRNQSPAPVLKISLPARETPKFLKYGETARVLCVDQKKSDREIGRELKIHAATVSKWRKRYGWDRQRQLIRTSPQGHVEDVALALATLIETAMVQIRNQKKLPANFFDDVAKGAKAIELLRGDAFFNAHLVRVIELLKSFLESTGKTELLAALTELLSSFTVYAMNSGK